MAETNKAQTVCEVHHVQMVNVKIPIIYGDVAMDVPYQEAAAKLFPHADRVCLGGCLSDESSPKEKTVYQCPKCMAARDAWLLKRNPPLALVKQLIDLKDFARGSAEKLLETKLEISKSESNQYFDIYHAENKSAVWKAVEVRIPRSRGGALVILDLHPNSVSASDVIETFGDSSDPLQPHIIPHGPQTGETLMKHRLVDKNITWIFSDSGHLVRVIMNNGR